jgi:hypothetical protein
MLYYTNCHELRSSDLMARYVCTMFYFFVAK